MQKFHNLRRRTFSRLYALVALLFCTIVSFAQNNITGTVTDETGEPLIGAAVKVKGTEVGAMTNFDGEFSLPATMGQTLVVSYVGYVPAEVVVKSKVVNIVLKENAEMLEDVVVIGYGTMKKKDVTGSITSIESKDLNIGAYTDPGQLLQGKVPGLVVVQNSDPNGGVNSMTLRGASTLNGSTSPLYVVDGIPGVELNLVSPQDIESIDVLRDASATAIYGSKAANGVIIITTKKGAEGNARVNYSGYVSWEKIANDHEFMSADELRQYAADNGLIIPNDDGFDTDWRKLVQRTGFAHNHNLSISGGNAKTNYNASVNYIERDGVIRGVGNNLFTTRTYVETKTLKDRLTLAVGINGNVRHEWGVPRNGNDRSVYDAMYYYSPLVSPYNEDGTYFHETRLSKKVYNPLTMIYEDASRATFKRLQVTGKVSLKIIEGLLLNANFSYQTQNYDYKDYSSHQSETLAADRNGQTSRNTTTDYHKLMEIYGNYDKQFGVDHKLSLMAGYSWEQNDTGEGFGARGYNFYDDTIWWNNIGMANCWDTDPVWANVLNTTRMISFYGRANYSYASKYLVTATVRRDGASTFGSNSRWATFPSASVAWRISEEKFMQGTRNWLSDLKLRVGWGQSGNSQGFNIYTSRFYYSTGTRFTYIDESGNEHSYKSINAARNVNNDLKWETTTMLNLGLDFAFLNGRINGTIEYYDKDTKDMIWDYAVSEALFPVGTLTANVGRMTNRGIELTVNIIPIQTRDWNWSTSLNFSHNKNKIKSISDPDRGFTVPPLNQYQPNLPENTNTTIQRIIEGEPIGTFYMWEFAGYDADGNSTYYVYDKTNEDVRGERLKDANGNFVTTTNPDEKDRVIVGNGQPWLTMGWNNTVTYKNWDLNIFFSGVFGQKIFNEPLINYTYIGSIAGGRNVMKDIVNVQNAQDTNSSKPCDRFLEDGSYFKLNTLTLGYTFRNCFDGWLDSIRLYVSGNNIFTITKYKGRDPEINLGGLCPGIDSRSDHFPRTRQILIGANINF